MGKTTLEKLANSVKSCRDTYLSSCHYKPAKSGNFIFSLLQGLIMKRKENQQKNFCANRFFSQKAHIIFSENHKDIFHTEDKNVMAFKRT